MVIDSPQEKSQRLAQRAGREAVLDDTTARNLPTPTTAQSKSRNPLPSTALCDVVQDHAERRAWDSNPQLFAEHLNSNQAGSGEKPEENGDSGTSAAADAAVEPDQDPLDPDLKDVILHWSDLPEAIKAAILAMIRSVDG